MGRVANAIKARGERVVLDGRLAHALIALETEASGGNRVVGTRWHFRVPKDETQPVKVGSRITARGKTLSVYFAYDSGDEWEIRAQ